jgi:hypothetical protein
MSKQRRTSKGKSVRPTFFVFCEGETKIKNATLIASNPCFELWYLLHYQNQQAELLSKECENSLSTHVKNYKKGNVDDKLKMQLSVKKEEAIERARKLKSYSNPSTDVFRLMEDLEKIKTGVK